MVHKMKANRIGSAPEGYKESMKRLAFVVPALIAAGLGGLNACATRGGQPATAAPATATAHDSADVEAASVDVRMYKGSPTISIFAWPTDDADYGLSTWVRRDGTQASEHRFYVSTYYTAAATRFNRAQGETRPFISTGIWRDELHCSGGPVCSPYETFGVQIPDRYLRSTRDSVPVTFRDRAGRELTITLGRTLIDAYLGTIDSVVASLRAK
jgi:hypothetical protein